MNVYTQRLSVYTESPIYLRLYSKGGSVGPHMLFNSPGQVRHPLLKVENIKFILILLILLFRITVWKRLSGLAVLDYDYSKTILPQGIDSTSHSKSLLIIAVIQNSKGNLIAHRSQLYHLETVAMLVTITIKSSFLFSNLLTATQSLRPPPATRNYVRTVDS